MGTKKCINISEFQIEKSQSKTKIAKLFKLGESHESYLVFMFSSLSRKGTFLNDAMQARGGVCILGTFA